VRLSRLLDDNGDLPSKSYASRLGQEACVAMCEWIRDHCSLGWKPGVLKKHKVQGNDYEFNVLCRSDTGTALWTLYKEQRGEVLPHVMWRPGRGTFFLLLRYITEESRSKACLSYFYVRLCDTFDLYKRLLTDCETAVIQGLGHFKELHTSMDEFPMAQSCLHELSLLKDKRDEIDAIYRWSKNNLRDHLKVNHIECKGCALHCIPHGLGACKEEHNAECKACLKFRRCGLDLRRFMQTRFNELCKMFESTLPEWYPRGSYISSTTSITVAATITTPPEEGNIPDMCAQCDEPPHEQVWCVLCSDWFNLPDSVNKTDLPEEWACNLRTWTTHPRWTETFEADFCSKTNARLIKAHQKELEAKQKQIHRDQKGQQATEQETSTTNVVSTGGGTIVDAVQATLEDSHNAVLVPHINFQQPLSDLLLDPLREGSARSRYRALLDIAQFTDYVPKYYAAHVGRGIWQENQISIHKNLLREADKAGKVAMFTIDMKSKTSTGKNREEQGFGMGAKGMSLQGSMLHVVYNGEMQLHFIDLIYNHTSNQTLVEAMTGLSAQLHYIRENFPQLETIWMVSDKCNSFHGYDAVSCATLTVQGRC
jgi:hypothetical protein